MPDCASSWGRDLPVEEVFEIGNKLARKIVLLGEDEVKSGILTVKDFASGEQTKVMRAELAQTLHATVKLIDKS